jgi:hypothetical protein
MKRAVKIGEIILIAVSFACFGFSLSFYYRNFPRSPQPELGRTYVLNNHGYYTYLTKKEHDQQKSSFYLSAIFGLVAVVMDCYADPFHGRNMKDRQNLHKRLNQPWNHKWGP